MVSKVSKVSKIGKLSRIIKTFNTVNMYLKRKRCNTPLRDQDFIVTKCGFEKMVRRLFDQMQKRPSKREKKLH